MSDPELTTRYTFSSTGATQEGPLNIDVSWDKFGHDDVTHIDWGQYQIDYNISTYYDVIPGGSASHVGTNIVINEGTGRSFVLLKSGEQALDAVYTMEDGIIQSSLQIESSNVEMEAQIVFRYLDPSNYYFAGIGVEGYLGGIGKVQNGTYTLLAHSVGANDNSEIEMYKIYNLRVEDIDDEIKLYINDILSCTATDGDVQGTLYGMSTWRTKARFQNFKIADKDFTTYYFFDEFGVSKKQNTIYIRNSNDHPISLSMDMLNVDPANLTEYLILYFNGASPALEPSRIRTAVVELEVLPTAINVLPNDGTEYTFSFEISLIAKKVIDPEILATLYPNYG